jgi:hypothetical protein
MNSYYHTTVFNHPGIFAAKFYPYMPSSIYNLTVTLSRAVSQAINRWFPTAAARVRIRAACRGFVVDKAALTQVLSEYFGFLCQSFHQFLYDLNHQGLAL